MITQVYNQGTHEIKIEVAENLEDAAANNFRTGEYSRYYIDGKKTDTYMSMVQFLIAESRNNKQRIIPDNVELMKMRKQLFDNQKKSLDDQMTKIKQQYKNIGLPQDVLEKIDDYMKKLDPTTNIRNVR